MTQEQFDSLVEGQSVIHHDTGMMYVVRSKVSCDVFEHIDDKAPHHSFTQLLLCHYEQSDDPCQWDLPLKLHNGDEDAT